MFFYEPGLDLIVSDASTYGSFLDAIQQSEDPLEISVTAAIDGNRLVVTLYEDANVIDVTEELE